MRMSLAAKAHMGPLGYHDRLDGWPNDEAGPLTAAVEITLSGGDAGQTLLVHLVINLGAATVAATAAGGSQHYFRLADATLRPLPAEAALSFDRGDAYIAVSPGARRLADGPAIARFLHLRDGFNAERLADGLLSFLAQESGAAEFPEDVTVLVVEAR